MTLAVILTVQPHPVGKKTSLNECPMQVCLKFRHRTHDHML